MLKAVREWIEQRTDLRQTLGYDEVATLVESPSQEHAKLMKHMDEQIALFQTLVRQGYIDAKLMGGAKTGGPFALAIVHDLTDKGYQLIDTLPDPRRDLLQRLDAIEKAILTLQDPNVSEEQKQEASRAIDTLRQLGIGVTSSGAYDILRGLIGG